jgi:hypothetical protein
LTWVFGGNLGVFVWRLLATIHFFFSQIEDYEAQFLRVYTLEPNDDVFY